MEEADTIICLKDETRTKRISKKLPRGKKVKMKNVDFFFFSLCKT